MSLHFCISNHKSNVSKVFRLKHSQEVFWHLWFWYLNTDREHPDVVEAQFAVVSSEDVELTLDNVSSMSAPWSRLELRGNHLLPVVGVNVKDMDIIHPVHAIIASEINDF